MQATLWALDVETGETLWETKLGETRPTALHCTGPDCHFLYLASLCYSKTLMIDSPNDCGDTLGAHTGLRGGIVQILINN